MMLYMPNHLSMFLLIVLKINATYMLNAILIFNIVKYYLS